MQKYAADQKKESLKSGRTTELKLLSMMTCGSRVGLGARERFGDKYAGNYGSERKMPNDQK